MKKYLLLFLLVAFGTFVSAGAQERWMVNQTGTLRLDKLRAPLYSLGVEVSCYLLRAGSFRVGPGAGVLYSRPYCDIYEQSGGSGPYPLYEKALTMPLFFRMEYGFGSEGARFFALLDVGTHVTLAEQEEMVTDKHYVSLVGRYDVGSLQALYLTPQVGVNFGKHYYAAAGVWCQWARSRYVALAPTASASLRIGVRF